MLQKEVIGLIIDIFGLENENIFGDSKVEKLAKDSLDLMELMAVLSDRYKIPIKPSELEKLVTIDDVVEYISENRRD